MSAHISGLDDFAGFSFGHLPQDVVADPSAEYTPYLGGQPPQTQSLLQGGNVLDTAPRLQALEIQMRWIYDNQVKLTETFSKVLSTLDNIQNNVAQFYEVFSGWVSEWRSCYCVRESQTPSDVSTLSDESETTETVEGDDADDFTDLVDLGKYY